MPLRDHFRPPPRRWRQVHGMWPALLVVRLNAVLPPGYEAGPNVQIGPTFELDIGTVEHDGPAAGFDADGTGGGGTATLTAPPPTLTADGRFLNEDDEVAVEVRNDLGTLVAAVEFVSPANKDRPETRRAFAAKCAALLRRGVSVAVVDVVTERAANLYGETLAELGAADPALGAEPAAVYAASVRRRAARPKPKLDAWAYPLEVGGPLPTLPLWLADDLWVPLDLDASYEDACRALRIP